MRPHLEILPPVQLAFWPELIHTPKEFVLFGGTAVALHLGHRESIDFDFFSALPIHPNDLLRDVPYLKDAEVKQLEANTLTAWIERGGGTVQLSFFGRIDFPLLASPETENLPVSVASLIDLAAMKLQVIMFRAEAKDYLDIDAMLQTAFTLPQMLAAAKAKFGNKISLIQPVMSLAYFEDGNLPSLPIEIRQRLANAARAVNLNKLPSL